MTTTEYLQREIDRTELSVRRAERKPNTPAEELHGLREKLEHLRDARAAVEEHWRRVHSERDWLPRINREAWETCMWCVLYRQFDNKYCPLCGRPLSEEAWEELERRVCGG